MSEKSEYVEYELAGCEPPLDVAGALIREGDWIVYAQSLGTSTALAFGRAYPMTADRIAKDDSRPINYRTKKKAVSVAVVTARRHSLSNATLSSYAANALVIDKMAVPEDVRTRLDFTRDELRQQMSQNKKDAKRYYEERIAKYKAEEAAKLAAKGCV